jgi:CRISPR/Cas system-associated protein Csm6
MASAGVGVVAAGLLLCAMVVGQHAMYPRADELTSRNDNVIASMQGQVQHQLLEAAKRHALAEKHEVQSVKLDNAALQEREQAELLKRRATLAKSEAELERARDDVKTAHSKLEVLQSKSDTLLSTARADKSGADDAKEEVMQLEDKAAALSQKAALEEDKIKLVESKQNKAAAALPKVSVADDVVGRQVSNGSAGHIVRDVALCNGPVFGFPSVRPRRDRSAARPALREDRARARESWALLRRASLNGYDGQWGVLDQT